MCINELELIKIHLKQYTDYLLKNGYCDSDVYDEKPTSIDRYLKHIMKKNVLV